MPTEVPAIVTAPERPSLSRDEFLAERSKVVDARQRAQQRSEQLVTAGAGGALVLSITFLDNIAPTPLASTRPLLITGWILLFVSLLCTFLSSLASQRAFEIHLRALDADYQGSGPVAKRVPWTRVTQVLFGLAASTFIAGVGFLAWFALVNTPFTSATP